MVNLCEFPLGRLKRGIAHCKILDSIDALLVTGHSSDQ